MDKKNVSSIKLFSFIYFLEAAILSCYFLELISMRTLCVLMICILGFIAFVATAYYSSLRLKRIQKEMEAKVVTYGEIKKNVDDWIAKIQDIASHTECKYIRPESDYYAIPRIQCPRCSNENWGIHHKTMMCGSCGFIIPENFQPPKLDALMEFFKEEKKKANIAAQEKREEERKEMIRQTSLTLALIGYKKIRRNENE